VVQTGGAALRSVADAPAGTALRIRLRDGAMLARSQGPEPGAATITAGAAIAAPVGAEGAQA
jgi:hypothetical protein